MSSNAPLPETFGRYRILRKLGEGGMGAVYLAEDTFLGREVALKVPHFSDKESQATSERFLREARAAAVLIHPDICPILDAGQVDGVYYMTMPFVEGQPLSRYLGGEAPWPVDRACALVRRLALAVGALHLRGLVHRDLKPGNVMVRPGGEPILMDFGLARSFTSHSQRLTASGASVGTPAYMAPEQVRGEADAIGPATDVYALGVILYELLTGSLPFEGPPALVYGQILHAEATAITLRRPELDPRLQAVCRQAMAKTPADRFPGVTEFVVALEPFLAPTEGRAPDPVTVPVAASAEMAQHSTADYEGAKGATPPIVPVPPVAALASATVPLPPPTASPTRQPAPRRRAPWLAVVAVCSTVVSVVLLVILLNKPDPEPTPEELFRQLQNLRFNVTFPNGPEWNNFEGSGRPVPVLFGNTGGPEPVLPGFQGLGGGGMMSGNPGSTVHGNFPGMQEGGIPNRFGIMGGGDFGMPKELEPSPFPKR